MLTTTVHCTWKQKWFSFIGMIVASLLPMIATLNATTTAYGAASQPQALSSSITISVTAKMPSKQSSKTIGSSSVTPPSSKPVEMAIVVFFTRPLSCAQSPSNCQDNMKLYAPDSKVTCSSPMSDTADSSWITKGEECPYLTCNYLSITSCTAQKSQTLFHSLPQPIPNVGDSYMLQLLQFDAKDLASASKLQLNGCIYYGNWPQFSTQNTQLALTWPGLTPLSATPLPQGVNLQKIFAQPIQQSTKTGTLTGTGWNMP